MDLSEKISPQVIDKGIRITKPNGFFIRKKDASGFSSDYGFLDCCFLCRQKLLPGKDIYIYKGEEALCSDECRQSQIFMDEEETNLRSGCTLQYNSSLAAAPSSKPSSSSSSSRAGKGSNLLHRRLHALAKGQKITPVLLLDLPL